MMLHFQKAIVYTSHMVFQCLRVIYLCCLLTTSSTFTLHLWMLWQYCCHLHIYYYMLSSSISSKTLCGTSTPPSTRWQISITLTLENLLRYILHLNFCASAYFPDTGPNSICALLLSLLTFALLVTSLTSIDIIKFH